MVSEGLVEQLRSISEFFERSTSCLVEEDSAFCPKEGMFTAAQQVAHTAQTIDWFLEGMFDPDGFDSDFEKHSRITMACDSLSSAREWFCTAVTRAVDVLGSKTDEDLRQPLPDGPVMGGAPRFAVVGAIVDHTAHHRGALTVYSRLLGKVPKMPYADE
jgi:uncharacterized damage-inducible protein DinB